MTIVCIGDSLTYGYRVRRSEVWTKLMEKKYGIKVLNKGICGDSTAGMLSRFYHDAVSERPSHVIIMGGTNDFIMEVPASVVKSNIATMVHQANACSIVPIIGIQIPTEPETAKECWASITDFYRVNDEIQRYREWVLQFAQIFGVQVIDFYKGFVDYLRAGYGKKSDIYSDGLHLTAVGNEIIAAMVDEAVIRMR